MYFNGAAVNQARVQTPINRPSFFKKLVQDEAIQINYLTWKRNVSAFFSEAK